MKKSAILLGGICVAALVAGGVWMTHRPEMKAKAAVNLYWNKDADINKIDANGSLPLIRAVEAQDKNVVEYLLEHGAQTITALPNGKNAINAAIKSGNVEILELLLAKSQAVLVEPIYMNEAIESGKADMVRSVLEHGGNANTILQVKGLTRPDEELDYMDPRVITPLKKVVNEGRLELVDVLLEKGAEGASYFLSQELKSGHADMFKALAKKVGNLRQLGVQGMDLLSYAAAEGNLEILEYLLKQNSGNVNAALMQSLVSRQEGNDYEKAAEMFFNAGAVPTADILELLLKKNKTSLFEKAADCLVKPNVKFSKSEISALRYAVDTHNKQAINYLLQRGADIWAEEKDGVSAFAKVVAEAKQEPEIFQLFKAQLKNINVAGYKGESLLMLWAQNGFYDEFKQTIDAGGDIWQKDNIGKTVLMYAAEGGNIEILQYLMKKGDNINAPDKNGTTPLMYAAGAGQVVMCRNMLAKGANLRAQDNLGKSAIMYAAEKGRADTVSFLLDVGDSVNEFDKNRKNVLMYALESGDKKTFDVVASKGMDVSLLDRDGVSILSYAVKGNNPEIVQEIMKKNANVYTADKNGYYPITYAIKNGNSEIVEMLHTRLTDIAKQTKDNGKSLSMFALESGNWDLIRLMVEKGKSFNNVRDNEGRSFGLLFARDGRPDMLRSLIQSRSISYSYDDNRKSSLMYAAEAETPTNLITVLNGMKILEGFNSADEEGKTALMYAVGGKYNQLIKQQRLMASGAKPDKADRTGKTVLMYAVGNPYTRVDTQAVNLLLNNGAKAQTADHKGKTALMYAAENPFASINVLEALILAGANVNAKDKSGKTVLMYATESGDISKYKLLVEYGASTTGKTNDGMTVEDFAD
ncbi:MAG: ankyrin repeat domain-containing protein, partial [Alphaproteobacteria bacterium]|nr:ankyrin repeat domain-containing protein [Alphaproteobacteria bacterium]